MRILIAEKNLNGRRMLNQILKMEGYEVSVAESGSHALNLLAEAQPDIVLMNVFQCMHSPDALSAEKLNASQHDEDTSPLLVTCNGSGESLADFMSPDSQQCAATFDLLPAKMKSGIMERIQQMCSALRQGSRFPHPAKWQHLAAH